MNKSFLIFGTLILSTFCLTVGAADKGHQKHKHKKHGKLAADMKVPKRGITLLRATKGNKVRGVVHLTQTKHGVRLHGKVSGLEPGKHGFHIHQYGDLSASDGKSAGGHFSPEGHQHGGPNSDEHHAGDLGNITANSQGVAKVDIMAKGLKLHFVLGRAIVVHGGKDDLQSQPSGDAGPRVAVGVIGYAHPMSE